MPTLLLRLAGPLQSWGTDSRFETRRTEKMPTKSGVIGMIASALGRSREENVFDLNELQFGVRIDQPGTIITDFHTAKKDSKTSYITKRYYLSDAVFLVGLYSESSEKLDEIKAALESPAFPLFLGRRSCPPDPDMGLTIKTEELIQALKKAPFTGNEMNSKKSFPIYVDGASIDREQAFRLRDQPQTFNPLHRKYQDRIVYRIHSKDAWNLDEHDAFDEVDK
ncbi:MAG: type I-E CRISPR-associated protein Cas5/CasD [Allobaculum sp.]|nr:type I-E CRISPR-associated protein Cas5/CasD [Allobaculum sp.]